MIEGAINLAQTTTDQMILDYNKAYSLSMDQDIDKEILDEIRRKGFSRIPVHLGHEENAVVGILLVKSLIGYIPEDKPETLR